MVVLIVCHLKVLNKRAKKAEMFKEKLISSNEILMHYVDQSVYSSHVCFSDIKQSNGKNNSSVVSRGRKKWHYAAPLLLYEIVYDRNYMNSDVIIQKHGEFSQIHQIPLKYILSGLTSLGYCMSEDHVTSSLLLLCPPTSLYMSPQSVVANSPFTLAVLADLVEQLCVHDKELKVF